MTTFCHSGKYSVSWGIMQPTLTPMLTQYFEIKKQYEDCLLFYRMGDFYELFMEDAHVGARVLNITLTSKSNGKNSKIPMAGVPYHAVDSYLPKLVRAGYKVAICEQLSPPNKKGLVKRDVVRIVTPGTLLDEKSLDKKDNNYIISITVSSDLVAFAVADLSTGYFLVTEIPTTNREQTITDELARIHPSECILSGTDYNNAELLHILKTEKKINIFPFAAWETYTTDAKQVLQKHFGVATLAGFGIEKHTLGLTAAAALLGYLQETQKGQVGHIKKIIPAQLNQHLLLDRSTILNLELFSTIREHDAKGTLLAVMDHTVTALGGRLLKQWMRRPLIQKSDIEHRHDAVALLLHKQPLRQKLREQLQEVADIERLLSRLSVGLGNARDLVNLKKSLEMVVTIKEQIQGLDSDLIREIAEKIMTIDPYCHPERPTGVEGSPTTYLVGKDSSTPLRSAQNDTNEETIQDLILLIEKNIAPEPPISIREGGMIQTGIHKELDHLRNIVGGSREWILEMEKQEREKTGISSLKVRFNQVFGFYIEISKANVHLAPAHYMRKQTLVNGERFITPELKQQEEIILTAEQTINDIEYQLFQKVLQEVLDQVALLQNAAEGIAQLDCLLNYATLAEKYHYVRPTMTEKGSLDITEGRHPVVEQLLVNEQFVPNDVMLTTDDQQLILITGPNMAGKSVFIRQVALIVLMAQMGSFVPAKKATISITDHIFVRSGASDVITSGLSTFMVEMVETAYILHHATKKSLIIMDEIGRGTSTYDGISIAWAVAEYLVTQTTPARHASQLTGVAGRPKTLFATHYHELQVLEEHYPKQIKNFHMSVAQEKGRPIFLHTIMPGGASHSFGVAVARLAGIPESVIARANELLRELEKKQEASQSVISTNNVRRDPQEISHARLASESVAGRSLDFDRDRNDKDIIAELEKIDIHQMTPLEAMNKLSELKGKLKFFTERDKKLLQAD